MATSVGPFISTSKLQSLQLIKQKTWIWGSTYNVLRSTLPLCSSPLDFAGFFEENRKMSRFRISLTAFFAATVAPVRVR
jgi:hypothetical protein